MPERYSGAAAPPRLTLPATAGVGDDSAASVTAPVRASAEVNLAKRKPGLFIEEVEAHRVNPCSDLGADSELHAGREGSNAGDALGVARESGHLRLSVIDEPTAQPCFVDRLALEGESDVNGGTRASVSVTATVSGTSPPLSSW